MTLQHLRLVSIFQAVQGAMEIFMGLLFALSPGGTGTGAISLWWWVGLCLAGLVIAFNGLLRIVGAALGAAFRGRWLNIGTLVIGLLSSLTCLCLPTSVALCIYGLAVYASKDVRRAFAMRSAGTSVDEIVHTWETPRS
jgi:hypothetical protein